MSSGLSSESNTSRVLAIREGFTDLAITILPSWICHLISTWAGVRAFGDGGDLRLSQQGTLSRRCSHLGGDAAPGVHFPQFCLGEPWMQLDLVDCRNDAGGIDGLWPVNQV